MIPDASYNDFRGNVAADIAHLIGQQGSDTMKQIGRHLGLDEDRFEMIGLNILYSGDSTVSFLCIDKHQSTETYTHMVSMMYDKNIPLNDLFEQIRIVLFDNGADVPDNSTNYEEVRFSSFHGSKW